MKPTKNFSIKLLKEVIKEINMAFKELEKSLDELDENERSTISFGLDTLGLLEVAKFSILSSMVHTDYENK